jgi:hypothetical protein
MYKPVKDWNAAVVAGINAREIADAAWAHSAPEMDWRESARNDTGTDAVLIDARADRLRSTTAFVANVALVASEWPRIDHAAFHGLAGDVVRTIEPHSEADPVAILIQVLAFVGNVIGRGPYYQVELTAITVTCSRCW